MAYGYDPGGALTTVDVWLQQAAAPAGLLDPTTADRHLVTSIAYNPRGQRAAIAYGNGVAVSYAFDPLTFRLTRLTALRPASFAANARAVQDLRYFYDPVGNITRIRDDGDIQNVVFFANRRVEPSERLHLRSALSPDRRPGPRASWPDRRRVERRPTGHRRRLLPHPAAPARRRQCDGHLCRELRLRRARQHPVDGACRGVRRLDAELRLQRGVAHRRRRDRQPAHRDQPAGRSCGRAVLGDLCPRCPRQHDRDAASAGDGVERGRSSARHHAHRRRCHTADHLLRL